MKPKREQHVACHEIEWDMNREEGDTATFAAGLVFVPTSWSLNDKRVRRAVINAVVEEFRGWLEATLPKE